MKIISIVINNNKAIECFSINPNGNNVEVAGTTGKGKTTAISALWSILEKGQDQLSHGAKRGSICVTLEGSGRTIVATRKMTKKTNSVILECDDGSPLTIKEFKKMISGLSVNPNDLMRKRPTDLVKSLLSAFSGGEDELDDINKKLSEATEERLMAKRAMDKLPPLSPVPKVKRECVLELSKELLSANKFNTKIDAAKNTLDGFKSCLTATERRKEELEEKMQDLRDELEDAKSSLSCLEAKIKKGTSLLSEKVRIDVTGITDRIKSITENNDAATLYEQWILAKKDRQHSAQEWEDLNDTVKSLQEMKKDFLDNIEWPLEGLSIEDGDILFEGSLLRNLGESKQALVCSALALKDILNHEIRVVRLDGVERMSLEDFADLQGLFNDHGIQVLSTRVARGDLDKGEIEITEGVYVED